MTQTDKKLKKGMWEMSKKSMKKIDRNYMFALNINDSGESGIVDIYSQTVLCLCSEDNSKIILHALSLAIDKSNQGVSKLEITKNN